jgi:hypothetical protein
MKRNKLATSVPLLPAILAVAQNNLKNVTIEGCIYGSHENYTLKESITAKSYRLIDNTGKVTNNDVGHTLRGSGHSNTGGPGSAMSEEAGSGKRTLTLTDFVEIGS